MILLELLSNPLLAILYLGILVITISIHEYAHARVADELGDPTAQIAGRLTINPMAHLDPWGSLAFLFFGFGWGKPVPFDPYNLKNPDRDVRLIALAGPISNLLISIIYSLLDEFHQMFVPGRDANIIDILTDTIGIFSSAVIYSFISRKKK